MRFDISFSFRTDRRCQHGFWGAPFLVQLLGNLVNIVILFRQSIVLYMVDANSATGNLDSVQIVYSQDGAPLIFVAEEGEAL